MRICHVHNGQYIFGDEGQGCQHVECMNLRLNGPGPLGIMVATVPGGANDTPEHQWHMKGFDKEMTAYKGAIDNGLNPSAITMEAVEAAERGYEHLDRMKFDDKFADRKDEKRNARAKQQLVNEGIDV